MMTEKKGAADSGFKAGWYLGSMESPEGMESEAQGLYLYDTSQGKEYG